MNANNNHYIGANAMLLDTSDSSSVSMASIVYSEGVVMVCFRSNPDAAYYYKLDMTTIMQTLGENIDSVGRFVARIKERATQTLRIDDEGLAIL